MLKISAILIAMQHQKSIATTVNKKIIYYDFLFTLEAEKKINFENHNKYEF